MIRELIYDNTPLPLYRNALDAYADRHRAVASNIANDSTPGYIPYRVSFERQLTQAIDRGETLRQTHPEHLPNQEIPANVRHKVFREDAGTSANGANGVEIEREISTLLTNEMHYTMVAKRAADLFDTVRQLNNLP